jgi:hypothetical protein
MDSQRRYGQKRRGQRVIAYGFAITAVLLVGIAPMAAAQVGIEQARCRKSLGKGVRKLAETVVKERAACHKLRMLGSLGITTDCNDPGASPASIRISAAKNKLTALAVRGCSGLAPADADYVVCPVPCAHIAISDIAGVAACFACVTEQRAGDAVASAYGTPPAPAASAAVSCQDKIGRALRGYVSKRMTEQQRCQLAEDRSPTPLDCRTADARGKIAKARQRADALIAACDASGLAALNSCATTVAAEQACVKTAVDLQTDALFEAVYRPAVPIATATPTDTPTPTTTPTAPDATATHTPAPSHTPTPTSVPPTPTPPLVQVGMTAYRPQTEAYGAPFQRRSVPNGEKVNPGVGIRINGDDDNNNGVPDRDEAAPSGENDLIEVVLTVSDAPPPPGIEYVLVRSSAAINVFNGSNKGSDVLSSTDESVLSFASPTRTVWVENPYGGGAFLELQARTTPGGTVVASDQVFLRPFTSIVIALGGENQVPADPPDSGHGIFNIAANLYAAGYDVHMYDEDDVSSSGAGPAYNEVVRAIQGRGITVVTIFGYSHGGGSTHDLAQRLDNNRGSIGTFTFPYTAYIDGIRNSSDIDIASETRLPPATQYHVNYYQRNDLFIRGNSVPGANVDVNVNNTPWGGGLAHSSIDDHVMVREGVLNPLLQLVSP